MSRISRNLIVAAGLLLVAYPALAQVRRAPAYSDSAVRFHLGLFEPDGDSQYWNDKRFDFTGDANDFDDVIGSIDYFRFLGRRVGLLASISAFTGETDQVYLDFVDERGFDILHTTTLETTALNLGLVWRLGGRQASVVPYLGVGGGIYFWRLDERGDFIDFGTPDLEIFFADFHEEGETLGLFFLAGLEVPLSRSVAIFAEARWHSADDDLGGDFEGLGVLDLSGSAVTAGLSWSL